MLNHLQMRELHHVLVCKGPVSPSTSTQVIQMSILLTIPDSIFLSRHSQARLHCTFGESTQFSFLGWPNDDQIVTIAVGSSGSITSCGISKLCLLCMEISLL